ncbi:MAG: DUF5710 domain-containing protein [Acidimicrobiales bacterium]
MTAACAIVLDVPFAENNQAKALGARWDPNARCWYVPAGIDPGPFEAWLPAPPPVLPDGPTTPAGLLLLPEACYRCAGDTTCVVGLLVDPDLTFDPDGFVAFHDVAEALALLLSPELLAAHGIGRLRHRRSSVRPEGYVSNGCRHCDTIMGSFPLHEALGEYLAEGGEYRHLLRAVIDLPVACLPVDDDWDEDELED